MFTDEGRLAVRLQVRWQDREHPHDLPQLEDLFHDCFPGESWTEKDFVKFRQNQAHNNTIKVLVGHPDDANRDTLYGAVLYTVGPLAVRVRRVAVAAPYRRRMYGSFLMSFLVGRRSGFRRKTYTAHVPEDNLAAQCFFRSLKFTGPEDGRAVAVNGRMVLPFTHYKALGALVGV